MKKSIYLTVITIVTIVLIVVGMIWNVSPLAGIHMPWTDKEDTSEKSVNVTKVWEEQELGECRELILSMDAADVTIETGDRCEIRFEGSEKLMPVVQVENGRWTVRQEEKSFNFKLNDLYSDFRLTITIPQGMTPETVKTELDAGDLNIKGIHAQVVDIQADAGDLDLEGVEAQNLKMDVDAGDIKVVESTFAEGKVDADMGDLKMERVVFTQLSAEMDAGSVNIHSAVPLDDAELNLDVDLGEIQVNGQEQRKSFHQQGSSGTRLSVTADMGDIKVTW